MPPWSALLGFSETENKTAFSRNSHRRCSIKKAVIKNFSKFTGKHLRLSLSFLKKLLQGSACNFINKEFLAQVFSCEFWKIFKNTSLASGQVLLTVIINFIFFQPCFHFIFFRQNAPEGQKFFKSLNFREREYLEFIRQKNTLLYGDILEKLKPHNSSNPYHFDPSISEKSVGKDWL